MRARLGTVVVVHLLVMSGACAPRTVVVTAQRPKLAETPRPAPSPSSTRNAPAAAPSVTDRLVLAAYKGDVGGVRMALERGGDINGVSRLGQTPSGAVATAVRQNKFEVLQFLIARGAALTALPGEAHGSSALHVAAAHGASSDIMRLIHHSGVPVDARDTRGLTPSMVAADSASASLGELIHLRADPSAVDADGRSLWQHAYVGLRQLPTVETMCPLPVAGGQASLASSRPEPYPWLEAVPRDSLAKIFPRCDVNIAAARRAHEVLIALEAILASETRAWQVGRADIQSDRALCRNIAAHIVLSSVAYTTQWNQRVRRADFRLRESGNEMYRERTWVTSSYTAFERLMRATRPCLIGPGTPPP